MESDPSFNAPYEFVGNAIVSLAPYSRFFGDALTLPSCDLRIGKVYEESPQQLIRKNRMMQAIV